jgi:hypothetical protein
VISCKWVLTKKCDMNGNITIFKVRLVAWGCRQVFGVDYNETFAPTLKMVPLRLLFSITARFNLELHHLDVETTFLHGDLNEEIYMKQPPYSWLYMQTSEFIVWLEAITKEVTP